MATTLNLNMVERSAKAAIDKVIKDVIAKHRETLQQEIEDAVAEATGKLSVNLLQNFSELTFEILIFLLL